LGILFMVSPANSDQILAMVSFFSFNETGQPLNPMGIIKFNQDQNSMVVSISGTISGLSPNSLHGFHVHADGNLTQGCTSASGHYNPFGKTHAGPMNATRHVGDLGNVQTDANGVATVSITDSVIQLCGPYSIVGRAMVVHALQDDLGSGTCDQSLANGCAGARVGCGLIGFANAVPCVSVPSGNSSSTTAATVSSLSTTSSHKPSSASSLSKMTTINKGLVYAIILSILGCVTGKFCL